MVKAIRFHEFGGPEVLKYEDVEVGDPGPGEVRLRHTAIGFNFLDALVREGRYPVLPDLPAVPGAEAAGIIEAVGDGDCERCRVCFTDQARSPDVNDSAESSATTTETPHERSAE